MELTDKLTKFNLDHSLDPGYNTHFWNYFYNLWFINVITQPQTPHWCQVSPQAAAPNQTRNSCLFFYNWKFVLVEKIQVPSCTSHDIVSEMPKGCRKQINTLIPTERLCWGHWAPSLLPPQMETPHCRGWCLCRARVGIFCSSPVSSCHVQSPNVYSDWPLGWHSPAVPDLPLLRNSIPLIKHPPN